MAWICLAFTAGLGPAWAANEGATLYHNYCSVCHGDKGDGKSRATGALSTLPRDFTSAASRQILTREFIRRVVSEGKPGTAMVGWKTQLSDLDIERVADFVMTQFVQATGNGATPPASGPISGTSAHGGRTADPAFTSTPRVDLTAGLPNGLKGDPKRGGAFYVANCATCHGVRGDGAGPRAYFINPKPRNFLADESRSMLNRVALYGAISQGKLRTEMPAWDKVASPQQIADVAEYVFETFITPRPAAPAASPATRP